MTEALASITWAIWNALGRAPIQIAYLCDTHPETGWIQFRDWATHVMTQHPDERVADISVAYRNSERRADGSLRLGSLVRHT